jgi:tetratricopeptide (TPR) repeat protein
MTILKTARFAALMAGGSMLLATAPGLAQRTQRANQQAQPPAPARQPAAAGQQAPQRRFNLSRPEQAAIAPLLAAADAAVTSKNWAPVQALLPAAQAAARGNDAKYLVTRVQYQIATGSGDRDAQERAANALLLNSATPADEAAQLRTTLSIIQNGRAEAAFAAQDYATAERIYRQLLQASPTDERLLRNLRIIQERSGNTAGALQGIQQEIQAAEASGQRAPEALYQRAWQVPYRAGQRAAAMTALQSLLRAYPTAANWRQAVDLVRETTGRENQSMLDTYRFARAVNVVKPAEYLPLAQTLDQAGLPGETKAVIDAGVAAGAVQGNQADVVRLMGVTNRRIGEDRAGLPGQIQQARSAANGRQARIAGDVLYGYGRYAEAAELYRLALTKGGEDANLINTRLGASLAMAGQRAGAETALRAVTGTRAELASLWLAWLNRPQG